MAKTTYKECQQRRRRAAELLAGGLSPAEAVSRLTAEWGCSRRTCLRDVNLGQDALVESIDTQTHAQLAAWCVASYALQLDAMRVETVWATLVRYTACR